MSILMKDKIITTLQNKKNPSGSEAFLLICADADELSPNFKKAFNAMLKDLMEIEKLKEEQKKLDQNITKTYGTLTQHGSFHAEIAKILLKELEAKEIVPAAKSPNSKEETMPVVKESHNITLPPKKQNVPSRITPPTKSTL